MLNISHIQLNITYSVLNRKDELIAIVSIFTIVTFVGLLLSITLFLTILFRPELHTGSGILIAHHQMLHILQIGITQPLYMVTGWIVWLGASITGINCLWMNFFCKLITFTEIWTSLVLAVNRFVALVYPHHYNLISSNRATILLISLPGLVSLALTVPSAFGIGSLFGMRQVDCGYIEISSQIITGVVFTLGIYLPLILQGVLYLSVLAVHYRNTRETEISNVQKKRFVIFRLLFGSYLWYLVCYLPQPVLIYGFPQFWFEDKVRAGWFQALQTAGYAGSPVFLLLMNKNIVRDAEDGIQRLCCKRSFSSVAPSKIIVSSHVGVNRRRP